MRTIHKYPIKLVFDVQTIDMPISAKVLHFAEHINGLWLWVELDDEAPVNPRHFQVIGTGGKVPGKSRHVATILDGSLVWHLYVKGNH